MAFSWKMAKVRQIKKLQERKANYLKHGRTKDADDIIKRVKRLQDG